MIRFVKCGLKAWYYRLWPDDVGWMDGWVNKIQDFYTGDWSSCLVWNNVVWLVEITLHILNYNTLHYMRYFNSSNVELLILINIGNTDNDWSILKDNHPFISYHWSLLLMKVHMLYRINLYLKIMVVFCFLLSLNKCEIVTKKTISLIINKEQDIISIKWNLRF